MINMVRGWRPVHKRQPHIPIKITQTREREFPRPRNFSAAVSPAPPPKRPTTHYTVPVVVVVVVLAGRRGRVKYVVENRGVGALHFRQSALLRRTGGGQCSG